MPGRLLPEKYLVSYCINSCLRSQSVANIYAPIQFRKFYFRLKEFSWNWRSGDEPLIAPEEVQENFIKKRVFEFFSEKNFKTPAIKSDEISDEAYSEKDIWENIKNEKNAIEF